MHPSVLHVNFSQSGGAGSVARTLHEEQSRQGVNSAFVHVIDRDLRNQPTVKPAHTIAAGFDHYILRDPGFSAPISVLRDRLTGLSSLVRARDVIHLHGINGALRFADLAHFTRGKKVVWTLHDMNPFTGVCHYSLGCQQFRDGCNFCPALRHPARGIAPTMLQKKIDAVSDLEDLTVVAPSAWLAEQAATSLVFNNTPVRVQPNPISPVFFEERPSGDGALNGARMSVVVVAASLDDPLKNVSAVAGAFSREFGEQSHVRLKLVGAGGERFRGPNIEVLGAVSASRLSSVLAQSDVLVVASLAENAPLVIPEAASQGCEALVANVGGMPELVKSLGVGEVFRDSSNLGAMLQQRLAVPQSQRENTRRLLKRRAADIFSPAAVATAYARVYEGEHGGES